MIEFLELGLDLLDSLLRGLDRGWFRSLDDNRVLA
jgi:hypothetical protein